MFTGGTVRRLQVLSSEESRMVAEPLDKSAPTDSRINEATVRALLTARRVREQQFGYDLFGEPAWDILLGAFAAHLGHQRIFVSDLDLGPGICPSTTTRWIRKLQQDGWLITSDGDPAQPIELTSEASERLRRYFEAILPGLPGF